MLASFEECQTRPKASANAGEFAPAAMSLYLLLFHVTAGTNPEALDWIGSCAKKKRGTLQACSIYHNL